jgi:hypothetical protein
MFDDFECLFGKGNVDMVSTCALRYTTNKVQATLLRSSLEADRKNVYRRP